MLQSGYAASRRFLVSSLAFGFIYPSIGWSGILDSVVVDSVTAGFSMNILWTFTLWRLRVPTSTATRQGSSHARAAEKITPGAVLRQHWKR